MIRIIFTQLPLLYFVLALVAPSVLAETVRYKNEYGAWAYTTRVPVQYLKNGYDVLNGNMRIIHKVPRAKTEEEIAAAAVAFQSEIDKKNAINDQTKYDQNLLSRYVNVDELELARKRQAGYFTDRLSILKGNSSTARQEIVNLQIKAARFERAGREVPGTFVARISVFNAALEEARALIEQKEIELQGLHENFDKQRERFILLNTLAL